jgi:hypothetical protein
MLETKDSMASADKLHTQSLSLRFAPARALQAFFRPETGIFLAIWLVLMVGGRTRLFRDPGTFWHTVVGERILSTGEFLDQDPFSYTFGGTPWTPYEWLAECGMALLHRIDGFDTLLLASVTLIAALFTWVAHRLMRGGLHWSLTALCMILLLAASASHLHVRPHLATIAFLGITFAWLVDFESGRITFRRLVWLIPLFIVWTNTHGGMLGGLGTIGLAVIGWSLWRIVGLPSPLRDGRGFVQSASLVVACGLTAFLNPYGADLPRTWYTIMHAPLLPELIQEHSPLNPTRPDGIMVLIFGAVYLFVLLGARPKEWRVTWLLPLVWLVLAYTRVRHAPLFAITAGLALADVLPHTRWALWLARPGSDLFQFPTGTIARRWNWQPALLPVLLVLVAIGAQMVRAPIPVVGHGWAQLDSEFWPVELIPDLRREAEAHPGAPIFNEYAFGGFLIYYTPQSRVYVDDRCEVYGDQWLDEYVRASETNSAPYLEECQRRYGRFDLALTQPGSGFDLYFRESSDWHKIAGAPAATLYQRTHPEGLERPQPE